MKKNTYLIILFLVGFGYNSIAQTTVSFIPGGVSSWTCPTGVTSVDVEVWGAGGGAGGGQSGGGTNGEGGGGGGGGGFSTQSAITVVPGATYNFTVGAGGVGGTVTNNGTVGALSTITIAATTVAANGGGGGVGGVSGAGATGGTGASSNGGNGGDGSNGSGAGGGGEGGCSTGNGNNGVNGAGSGAGGTGCDGGDGGAGRQTNSGNGNAGSIKGGGGGSGTKDGSGGSGGGGQINIIYIDPCSNGIQDGLETAIDCGGPDCAACAPSNDLCANAIALPCGTFEMDGTTILASNIAQTSLCGSSDYGVWFTFVGDGNSNTFWVAPDATFDAEMSISTGTCGSLTTNWCIGSASGAGVTSGGTVVTVLGTTYYVYVAFTTAGGTAANTGTFKISRACSDNNTCATASPLACGETLMGSTFGAASVADGTGCTISDIGSWYSFVGDGQVTTIIAESFTAIDFEMAITSGTCGSITNIACIDDVSTGAAQETYTFTATLGVTYNIYIYS